MSANEEFQEPELVRAVWRGALANQAESIDCVLGIEPKCFEGVAPAALWSAFRELLLKGKPLSEAGVRLALAKAGELGPEGQYWESFRELLTESHGHQPLNTLREGVWDAYVRRSMIELCENKLADLRDPENGGAEVANSIIQSVEEVTSTVVKEQSWSDVEQQWTEHGKLMDIKTVQGAWTGFDALDRVYPIPREMITTIAARPNTGKSLMLYTILRATLAHGQFVTFVNMDMSERVAKTKLISAISGVSYAKIMEGTCNPTERELVQAAIKTLKDQVEFIHFPAQTSWERIRSRIYQSTRANGSSAIMLDQFTQVGRERKYGDNDHTRWAYVSNSMKNLAQSTKTAFILLNQINREGTQGEPALSDLANTGASEQDSGGVIFLWQTGENSVSDGKQEMFAAPKVTDKFKNTDIIALRLAKSQQGPVGHMMRLLRKGDLSRFDEHIRYT